MLINRGDGQMVEADEVQIVDFSERFSLISLMNGDVIRLRPAVTQVFMVRGAKDTDGNQMYLVRSQNLMVVQKEPPVLSVTPPPTVI